MSKREVVSLLSEVFGIDMCEGSVIACERATSTALAAPVDAAVEHVRREGVAYVDETGWRERRKLAWLWVAVSPCATVFRVDRERSVKAARGLLEGFRGVLVSDRLKAHNDWPISKRQVCWAHLGRQFTEISERKGHSA